jgi:acetyl-CoA carboxylase biotin carboxyl carrier protein
MPRGESNPRKPATELEIAVADKQSNRPSPFDVQTVKLLVQLMARHDLSEIDLREGELRIRVRRGRTGASLGAAEAVPAPVALPAPSPPAPTSPPAEKPNVPPRKFVEIKAPTVGTFYAQEKPESPPYVSVGSRVTPSTVVGLIEAMKLFNEVPAGCNGVVVDVLIQNQQPVEFDQVLFRVDPSA